MSYTGPERRVHKVFITRNTEYHLRGDLCVAVRSRKTGQWLSEHPVLHQRAVGFGFERAEVSEALPFARTPLAVGRRLWFEHEDLLTGPVQRVERPPLQDVEQYPLSLSA
jgi:hypothetical protein